ncbi:MAG TPA: bifunctional alpha,alpha-trehalose-phosphate synthase (UDP-forming)/trehalose-phosphatase [Candidatus Saccharimonadales bacterium]
MGTFTTVVVSNRLPVSVKRVDGVLVYEASSGGLATAMASLEADNKIWVGWPGIDSDSLTDTEREEITTELKSRGCYPVFLTKKQTSLYYEGYANDTIWPLFHYFQSLARYDEKYWDSYQEVNHLFAEAVVEVSTPEAKIWIQDYHFMLLPQLIRERLSASSIGFFLHIPFPSFEIFRLLPQRKEILRGLLGADVIGFHIYDYGRHFISSCKRLLGASVMNDMIQQNGRVVKVGAFPIGIDYEKFRHQLDTKETKTAKKQLDKSYAGQKLILSVDRLDYSKGIMDRLEAFRLLLKEHPEYHGKIKLLMIAVPSRTEVDAYKQLRDEIEKTVSRINGTYGTVEWAPISYRFQNRPFPEIVALYERADIALVTPIRDGMNLVAKEYVASQRKPGGVLILSEMAGAIDELPEALTINPNDWRSIKDAIVMALGMSKKEQASRSEAMQRRIKVATVQNWGKEFMHELDHAADNQDAHFKKLLLPAEYRRIVNRYQSARKRLIILDYDGTLKGFVRVPHVVAGAPSLKARRILRALSEDPNNVVAIVSGRPKRALTSWFSGMKLKLVAEHGAWTRYDKKWRAIDSNFSSSKKAIREVMEEYTERTEGSLIEEKDYAFVWHYINVEPDLAYKRARELSRELKTKFGDDDISVDEGHNIIEVKPKMVNKGAAVRELMRRYPADFVFCAGDDYTDEDMFAVLDDEQAVTVKIGGGETRARYQVEDVAATLALLDDMVPGSNLLIGEIKGRLPSRTKRFMKKLFKK